MSIPHFLIASFLFLYAIGCTGKSGDLKERPNEVVIDNQLNNAQIVDDTSSIIADSMALTENRNLISQKKNIASIPWKLNEPDKIFKLSLRLKEISGLTYDASNNQLLAINDEQGIIFRLDAGTGKEISNENFAKKGDYEGIEMVGEEVYVLKSNGHIYRRDTSKKDGSELIRTDLRSVNDAEGLSYDPVTQKLLLACKGKTTISSDQKIKKSKVVYALDLSNSTLSKEPQFIIADKDLEQFVHANYSNAVKNQDQLKSLLKRVKSFAPSGIAYRASTDQFYLISSIGKVMVILDRGNKVVGIHFLDKSVHAQPEGICFDSEDRLYISNEGKFGIAKIYQFNS